MSKKHMALNWKDWHQLGLQLKQKGDYRKAIHAFSKAIDEKVEFVDSYFERGICFYKLGNDRQAADDLAAAALLGCEAAELWSKHDRNEHRKLENDNEP